MNPKDQNLSFIEETSQEQPYLTDSQIEEIRSRVEASNNVVDGEGDTLKALDDFVRANHRADDRYLRLKELADKAFALFKGDFPFPEHVKTGLLPIFLMAYFDLLLLAGVYKEDELCMSVRAMEVPGRKGNNEA